MPKQVTGLFGGGGSAARGLSATGSLVAETPGRQLITRAVAPGSFRSDLNNTGSAAQSAFAERFPRVLGDIDTLRSQLTPGFSDLRKVSRTAIGNARNRAVGDLRSSLSRRRVLGSSFAEGALAATEREFAEAEAAVEAQSFLAEQDANQRILAFETAQINDALTRELAELGIATGQTNALASLNAQSAQFIADLKANEQASKGSGLGSLLGTAAGFALGGPVGASIGGSLGRSIFGTGSTVGGPNGGFVPSGDRGGLFSGLFGGG